MPASTLPFQNLIVKQVGDDPDTKKIIEDFRLSNYAITPEVRFYAGKKGMEEAFTSRRFTDMQILNLGI